MIRFILTITFLVTILLANGQKKDLNSSLKIEGTKSETVTDIDGNDYSVVEIGTQTWMAENLKVTKYANGDNIDNVTVNETWIGLSSGAYSLYNNDLSTYGQYYGALYNWFAVADERNLCPDGWHIPTDGEWKQLELFLGMSSTDADATGYRGTTEGGELKSTRIEPDPIPRWDWPNTGATDEVGFGGLPGGFRRDDNGAFSYTGLFAYWWTSSESSSLKAWSRGLSNTEETSLRNEAEKVYGYSVRCIKDVEISATLPTVTTTAANSITQTTVVTGGNVTSDGGANITARGVVWSTSVNPTVEVNEGITSDGTDIGEFVSTINGLSPSTLYYLKAYATNSEGTAYGEEVQFTTLDEVIGETVIDIDGNEYPITVIGTQTWMAGNLKTTKYNDDTPIDYPGDDNATWTNATAGAYAWYSNDIANKTVYGALYNWLAVETGKLCPEGWHVPSDDDWKVLEAFLGIPEAELDNTGARGTDQGGMLKATGTESWNEPNTGATNSTGFSAVGHGVRYASNGNYAEKPYFGYFWTSTQGSYSTNAVTRGMSYSDAQINRYDISGKNDGRAVRCVKDTEITITLPSVTTASALDITQTSATAGGNVTSDGGASVTARGVVWSTSENPTVDLNEGITSNGTGSGEFVSSLTGLTANTIYFIKAYATNSEGTAYGDQVSFTTAPETTTQEFASLPFEEGFNNSWIDKNNTHDVPSIYWVNTPATGDNSWRRNDDGASAGWYSEGGTYTPSGANSSNFSARFHSYNAYPTGVSGILDLYVDFSTINSDKILSFWYINVSGTDKLEIQISENGGETFGEAVFSQTTATSWEQKTLEIGNPLSEQGVIRFIAYSDWGYSDIGLDEISIYQSVVNTIPTVSTSSISEVSQNSATGGGEVISEGSEPVTARGVVWSTEQNPTIEINNGITNDGTGTGSFTSSITGIAINTTYFVRAYATNSVGTAYGDEISFTTPDIEALSLPFTEGFESTTFPPDGWVKYIGTNGLGTSQSWFKLNTTSNTGSACAAINFENVTGGMAEDWLVTPKLQLNESNNVLKFYEKQSYSSNYGSEFKVKVSTTSQSDHSTFADVFTYNESDFGTTWTLRTIDLDEYAGQIVYIALVYINDDGDNWMVDDVQVIEDTPVAPVASFTANITSGYVPLTVSFTDQSTNVPTSWSWDFGDGSSSTEQNPSHTYTTAGEYTVTLTATNSGGSDVETKNNYITANAVVIPTLTTVTVTSITENAATSGGNISNNGGAAVTARGVVWSTSQNPTLESSAGFTTDGGGNGSFTSNLTQLTASTTYFVRAYATNSVGTAYGNQISFTTLTTDIDINEVSRSSVYPNPFVKSLTIENGNGIGIKQITIQNIVGQIVYQKNFEGENKVVLALENLKKGIFIVRISSVNGQNYSQKVVKN